MSQGGTVGEHMTSKGQNKIIKCNQNDDKTFSEIICSKISYLFGTSEYNIQLKQ